MNRENIRRLTLVEYQTCSRVALSPAERDALQEKLPGLSISPSRGAAPGMYDLTPSSWVGLLQLDGLAVEILPKLPLSHVLFLATHGGSQIAWMDEMADLAETSSLLDGLGHLYSRHVLLALRRGLLRGYRTQEVALSGIRGRLRLEDQVRQHAGRFPPVEVRFDEFTDDILENRLLKAAATQLLYLEGPARAKLQGLLSSFSSVETVSYVPDRIPAVTYTRLNAHYRSAVELARLILRLSSVNLRHGQTPAASLLLDMNRVFEDFVVVALRAALGLTERSFPQGCAGKSLYLDLPGELPLRPDISWWDGRRCIFVGDVKYKRTVGGEHADLYQLLAYATASGVPGGLLIYADGEAQPVSHTVTHAGKALHVITLDLRGTPADVLQQIGQVAERVRHLRDEAVGLAPCTLKPNRY